MVHVNMAKTRRKSETSTGNEVKRHHWSFTGRVTLCKPLNSLTLYSYFGKDKHGIQQ